MFLKTRQKCLIKLTLLKKSVNASKTYSIEKFLEIIWTVAKVVDNVNMSNLHMHCHTYLI